MSISLLFKTLIFTSFCALCLATNGQAADHRYEFQKFEDGFLRFDSDTGSIDKCLDKDGKITCVISDDDRARYEQEIKTLKDRIAALEQQKSAAKATFPNKQDMDQAYDTMKYFFDKFKNDFKDDETPANDGTGKL
ncbi:hypothetical protein [uncultured Bartonella sp.]|uniref:hypothetical protein n=1 Tax=uncultured Bartonella sp. TaxID=104108 RepID=UPI002620EB06|nr:hypothetical protein [uncultured Bartonella sp.]